MRKGFSLVELAIVLVIVALVIGGVLIGQDLIEVSQVRAQVSQFEKYNTAVNTFRSKYNGFPGDLRADEAQGFGFLARAGTRSHGDGNGILEKCDLVLGTYPLGCEFLLFWSDLSLAELIDEALPGATDGDPSATTFAESLAYFPMSKISEGTTLIAATHNDNSTWYVTMGFDSIAPGSLNPRIYPMTVSQAYAIDIKRDDGKALSGNTIITMFGQLDPVHGDQTFIAIPYPIAFQDVTACVFNDEYNLTTKDAILCYLAVKMQF